MRSFLPAALAVAALGLSACEGRHGQAANGNICSSFKQARTPAVIAADGGAGPVDECVRRWAYSLAGARDDAELVAGAAVTACNAPLARWNQQALAQPGGGGEAASVITGETTTPLAEHNTFTRERALFYVIQARAGHCAPPPAKDGVPEGVG